MKTLRLLLPLLLATTALPSRADTRPEAPFVPMRYERLPDLNIPRAGHQAFVANGELVVVGGHTTGFIRTATAEYFSEGVWHTLKTIYPNDNGFLVKLPDGDFLIGGGSDEDFGVGQSYGVQRYDPVGHSFSPFPILDIKRAMASAALLPGGQILVSGNWNADDAIGLSDGAGPFETIQESSRNRSHPYIFSYGKDDAVIFGWCDNRGEPLPDFQVDRLGGEPFTPDVFQRWSPRNDIYYETDMGRCRVVHPASGQVFYLFGAISKDGDQMAFLSFSDGVFAEIRTDCVIPVNGPWGPILWIGDVSVDPERGKAYLMGLGQDNDMRFYCAAIDYLQALDGEVVPVKVFHTAPIKDFIYGVSTILPDGRPVTIGGFKAYNTMGNYTPSAAVFAFSPFEEDPAAAAGHPWWPFALAALLVLTAAAWLLVRHRRPGADPAAGDPATAPDSPGEEPSRERELFGKVTALMEEQELFRQKGLGIADIATQLGTNTKYVSNCINASAGCPFNEYVNSYRIRYAQQLLRENPGARLSDVADAAGFSGESSFYRNFKAATGQTPQQWLAGNPGQQR